MRIVYAASAALWAIYLLSAALWRLPWSLDISLFRRVTTYECPLDGLTRSIYAAAHGKFGAAFDLNPMLPLYIGILLYLIYVSVGLATGRTDSVRPAPLLISVFATMALTIVARVIAGHPLR